MSVGLRRRCADLACRILQRLLPSNLRPWGQAVRHEAAAIPDDSEALRFALSSLFGLTPRILLAGLLLLLAGCDEDRLIPTGAMTGMTSADGLTLRPRALGIVCATGAVALGVAYLAVTGAPVHYLAINGVALLIGLVLLVVAGRLSVWSAGWRGALMLVAAGFLLATGLLGERVAGAARWVQVGALFVQPSLILLPAVIVAFAKMRDLLSTMAMIVAAVALAVQPDRAMAFVLAAALGVLAVMRPDRFSLTALAGGLVGFAMTLIQTDRLPAVPFVDQVFYSSFGEHVLAGAAVLGGSVLLLLPALAGWTRDVENRAVYAAFGTTWLAAMVAAALGNYPTPVVSYGGSAIIGYLICLIALPKSVSSTASAAADEVVCEADRDKLNSSTFAVGRLHT